ncbi:MAG: hypothetical protein EOO56_26575, partial [Hymenobacter sp.]
MNTRPALTLPHWLALAGTLLSLPALAQKPANVSKPQTILFVGNSFFHGAFQPVLSYNNQSITDENFKPNRT